MSHEFRNHHSIKPNVSGIFKTVISTSSPIITLSDIHGDIDALIICLRDCANVIRKKTGTSFSEGRDPDLEKYLPHDLNEGDSYTDDLNYEWSGEASIVVIVGDILDPVRRNANLEHVYPQVEIKILRLLNILGRAARKAGGNIIKLCGNHELSNFVDDDNIMHYMSDSDQKNANYYQGFSRQTYFNYDNPGFRLYQEGGIGIGVLINNNFFVHGGLNSEYTIENYIKINELLNQDRTKDNADYEKAKALVDKNSKVVITIDEFYKQKKLIEHYELKKKANINQLKFLSSNDSPLWTREFNYNNKDIPTYIDKEPQKSFVGLLMDSALSLFKKVPEKKTESNIMNHYFNILFANNTHKHYNTDEYRLIIGHSGQNASLLSDNNATLSHKEIANKKIIEYSNKSIYYGQGDFDNDLLFGISVACIQDNKETKNPRLIRVDYNLSRGFDIFQNALIKYCANQELLKNNIKNLIKILYESRTPQVCIIRADDIRIVKSTLMNTKIHLPRQHFSGFDKDHKSKIYSMIIEHSKKFPNCNITKETIDSFLDKEPTDSAYFEKYMKYKNKYLKLKA